EQKAIAAVLGALDDKIELNRRMNATLEAMARALFQSWFVDFDPVRAKLDGRPPAGLDPATAALFPEHLEDSPLGHIPKGWRVGKIQDCCIQIQNGGTPRRNEPRFWDGGNIPWLASGEVRQSIITVTENFITEEGLAESSAKWVPAFSTVVALYGATAGQVSFTSFRLTTNQAVCALIPKKSFPFFNYLTMRGATAEMENKAVGSAQQNISKGIVEETQVVLPPTTVIERFADVASPLFERWISNLHQSRTLATLRDTLLPKLLSGELSLSALEVAR
nr:restriction endonuclease subunit S [Chromatiaceae bacterium]